MKAFDNTLSITINKVCFLGDSITHDGRYIKELCQHYLDSKRTDLGIIEMYNCGISGDTAGGALKRAERDVFALNPDIVILMLGMNDISLGHYKKAIYSPDIEQGRQNAINRYKTNITILANKILDQGIELILCTPTPYDDVSDTSMDCNLGLNQCAEFIRILAQEKNLKLVDHYKNMYDLRSTKYWGQGDPIHPNGLGHHVIAQSIMKDLGYIDQMDLTTEMTEFDEINTARHTLAHDYCMYLVVDGICEREGAFTPEAKKLKAKQLQDAETNDHWIWIYQNFLDNVDSPVEMREKMIKLVKDASCSRH